MIPLNKYLIFAPQLRIQNTYNRIHNQTNIPMEENISFRERIIALFLKYFDNENDVKTINQLYDDYILVNNDIVKAMDAFENLINVRKKVTNADVDELCNYDINYSITHVDKMIIDQHGDEIKKIIIDASMTEAYKKSLTFFKNEDVNFWSPQLNSYKSTLIKISDADALNEAIDFITDLHSCLIDLYDDFNRDYSYNPFRKEFIFEELLKIADSTKELNQKKQIFVDAISNCEMFCLKFYDFEPEDIVYKKFMFRCHRAIEAIDYQIKNTTANLSQTTMEEKPATVSGKFKLSSKKKTDFIKILSAMYDNRMFETENGYLASNKQEIMNEFGRIVGEDLSNYSVLLSKSKETEKDVFLKPFDTIRSKAEEYYNKELNK